MANKLGGDMTHRALWGARAERRENALWGKGGRGFTAVLAALALAAPLAATSGGSSDKRAARSDTFVAPSLLYQARANPHGSVRVIVQSTRGASAAERALRGSARETARLPLIGAVAATIPAGRLEKLRRTLGLTVTRDALLRLTEYDADEENERDHCSGDCGSSRPWGRRQARTPTPTIAIVDSGIQRDRRDFDDRVVAEVNLATLQPNSPGDGRGHGTFVAGIAAGGARGHVGVAPEAKLVSIDVMDDTGKALTSDVIRAAEWILANRSRYGIRVANFSLHSGRESNFTRDPLDRAVERLWFSGVVVVTAAGNTGALGVKSAPGNDPFVITVGAVGRNMGSSDDYDGGTAAAVSGGFVNAASGNSATVAAPWSAYGYTHDGFLKPEVSAPGRNVVGPVPPSSTLALQRPDRIVSPGYMRLSGTSLAAPVVSGAAAEILARHPSWTPDLVKGALMVTAKPVKKSPPLAAGVGKIDLKRAAALTNPPNPNLALNRFLVAGPAGGAIPLFDAAGWESAARADASWDSASWSDASWSDTLWDSVSWSDASWSDVSWSDVSWSDVSWSDVSWSDVSWSDVSWSEGGWQPD